MALLVDNRYFKIKYFFNSESSLKNIVVAVYNDPKRRTQEKIYQQASDLFINTYKAINDLNINNFISEIDKLQHSGKYASPEELRADKPELVDNFLKEQDERDDLWLFQRDLLKREISQNDLKAFNKWTKLGFNKDWLNKWNNDLELFYTIDCTANTLEGIYKRLKEVLKNYHEKVEDC